MLVLTTSLPRNSADYAGRFVFEWIMAVGGVRQVLAPYDGITPPGTVRRVWRAPGQLLAGNGAPEQLASPGLKTAFEAMAATTSLTAAAIRAAQPKELVVGHWLVPCGLAAIAAARAKGGCAHLIAHGSDVALLERLLGGRYLARQLDAGATGITFVSENLRARFARLVQRPARGRWTVAPMGVHPPNPDPHYRDLLMVRAAGRKIIATVGRLTPIKGLATLAHALDGLDGYVWFCAGDGPLHGALPCADHLGRIDGRERDALLSVCDLFVLPSQPIDGREEGTPLSLLEALRSGAPIVATRVGGVPAIAGPAGARLIDSGDANALRQAILKPPSKPSVPFADRFGWAVLGPAHAAILRHRLQ